MWSFVFYRVRVVGRWKKTNSQYKIFQVGYFLQEGKLEVFSQLCSRVSKQFKVFPEHINVSFDCFERNCYYCYTHMFIYCC